VASGAGSGATGIGIRSDGSVLASGGNFTFNTGAYRTGIGLLTNCGEVDISYAANNPGSISAPRPYTLLLPSDGKVFLGGSFSSFQDTYLNGLVRLTTN